MGGKKYFKVDKGDSGYFGAGLSGKEEENQTAKNRKDKEGVQKGLCRRKT